MNKIEQKIRGNNNTQNIFFNNLSTIDIIPQDVEFILDCIEENISNPIGKKPIIIPDLDKKNILNGVDKYQFEIILDDLPLFGDIEASIREDNSNTLKTKYYNAARILNVQYMYNYQKEFSKFVVKVAKAYSDKKNFDNDKIIKLMVLMHYMYNECDLGIKP